MLTRTLGLLIILSVFGSSFIEFQNSASKELEIKESLVHHDQDDKGQTSNDCHDADDCCSTLCSCGASFIIDTKAAVSVNDRPVVTKQHWFFYNNYFPPILDLTLKPPQFS